MSGVSVSDQIGEGVSESLDGTEDGGVGKRRELEKVRG